MMATDSVSAVRSDLFHNLEKHQILEIVHEVSTKRSLISNAPSVLPKGGELFIFDLGQDKSSWESNKRKFR